MARRGATRGTETDDPWLTERHRHEGHVPEPVPEWTREDQVEDRASPRRRRGPSEGDAVDLGEGAMAELTQAVGPKRASRLLGQLRTAATDFSYERFGDAARILARLTKEAPGAASVRELYGLTLYRLEKWSQAIDQLEVFIDLVGGTTEEHHVLADCHRALGHHETVDVLWQELRQDNGDPDVVLDGRLVAAGSLADRGRLTDAIALVGADWTFPRNPKERHLKRAYVLGDLYERAGDLPRARRWFARVDAADRDLTDADRRLRELG